jgi:hypothetical protein
VWLGYGLGIAQSPSLQQEINQLLRVEWLQYGYCGVVVRDLRTGETLFQHEAEQVLIPASTTQTHHHRRRAAPLGQRVPLPHARLDAWVSRQGGHAAR